MQSPNLQDLADQLGLKTQAAVDFLKVALEGVKLFDNKQQDYGPGNIGAFGELGVVIRMNDKFERIKTLTGAGRKPRNEKFEDTYKDISNYAIIAIMLRRKLWSTPEGGTGLFRAKRKRTNSEKTKTEAEDPQTEGQETDGTKT